MTIWYPENFKVMVFYLRAFQELSAGGWELSLSNGMKLPSRTLFTIGIMAVLSMLAMGLCRHILEHFRKAETVAGLSLAYHWLHRIFKGGIENAHTRKKESSFWGKLSFFLTIFIRYCSKSWQRYKGSWFSRENAGEAAKDLLVS